MLQPAPSLMPIGFWVPLGVAIYGVQLACMYLCLRPRGRRLLAGAAALLASDLLLVVLTRAGAASLGAMDYSQEFLAWRWRFLLLGGVLLGLPIALWTAVQRPLYRPQPEAGARPRVMHPAFLASVLSWVAAGAITVLMGGEISYLARPARVTEIEVEVAGFPAGLDGLRIAVLSDHHVGALMTPGRARARLRSLAGTGADIVVELGDLTDVDPSHQREAAAIVGECRAPLGTYAVAGNFDVMCGTDSLRQELAAVGVRYLENEAVRVEAAGGELWIAGVGDPWTRSDDLGAALAEAPEGAPVVLLAHSPDIIEEAVRRDVAVVLSGHTHGGQVLFPFAGPVVGMSEYGTRFAAGQFRVGDTHLIVTRGLGEEFVPLRLFCPSEIVVVRLRCGADAGG